MMALLEQPSYGYSEQLFCTVIFFSSLKAACSERPVNLWG